jgi:hypothetical protein
MPNWCYNNVTIQGPKEEVDFIKNKLNTPIVRSYENWNPETKTYTWEEKTFNKPVFSFMNIISPTDWKQYNTSCDAEGQKNPLNWYNWNMANWGTKWDVACSDDEVGGSTSLDEHMSNGEDQWLVYRFDTAWAPPVVAITKLSELVPHCVVTLSYQEEQGWGGEVEFVNGKITAESDYDSKCDECDKTDCIDYCEDCQINYCTECGFTDDLWDPECEEHKGLAEEQKAQGRGRYVL